MKSCSVGRWPRQVLFPVLTDLDIRLAHNKKTLYGPMSRLRSCWIRTGVLQSLIGIQSRGEIRAADSPATSKIAIIFFFLPNALKVFLFLILSIS